MARNTNNPEPQTFTENRVFEHWAHFVLRFRWALLALTLVFTSFCAWGIVTQLTVDFSIESFMGEDGHTRATLDKFREDFGNDDAFIIMIEGDVFTEAYLTKLRDIHNEIEAISVSIPAADEESPASPEEPNEEQDDFAETEGEDAWGDDDASSAIEEIISLVNIRDTRAVGDSLEVGEFLVPFPDPLDPAAIRKQAMSRASWIGQVISPDAQCSAIVIRIPLLSDAVNLELSEAIQGIIKRYHQEGFAIRLAGVPQLHVELNALMLNDMQRMVGVSLFMMILVLVWLFRHPIAVMGPIAVVLFALISAIGMMAWAGISMRMLSIILPAFIVCVGIGDSVHLIMIYRDAITEGRSPRHALVTAITSTGMPILFTTITTMLGLLSFRFATLGPIREMGTVGAFGVLMAMLHTFVLLPIILSLTNPKLRSREKSGKKDLLNGFLVWCRNLSGDPQAPNDASSLTAVGRRRCRHTLIGGAVVLCCAIIGISMLKLSHNPIDWIPPDEPIHKATVSLDQTLGGSATIAVVVQGKDGKTVKHQHILQALDDFSDYIAQYSDASGTHVVAGSFGITDVVKETHQALHNADAAFYAIPKTDRGAADMLFMFENAGYDKLHRLATNDFNRAQVTHRIKWLDATSYQPLDRYLRAGITKFIPDDFVVELTGSAYTLLSTIGTLVRDLIRSFGFALIAITILMTILLRSVKLGLIAMVPNLLPILVTLGWMGTTGIPMDMNNVLIGSIAIGIAVDDTIHFLHQFRVAFERTNNVELAINHALKHCGRAIVGTTIILLAGFACYITADMRNVERFGALVSMSCVLALVIDLILAPALLRAFYKSETAS